MNAHHPKRHEDWEKVQPGHIIPAGQPYRVEYDDGSASEHPNLRGAVSGEGFGQDAVEWLVDSSWRPPLALPTAPTWGISVNRFDGARVGKWAPTGGGNYLTDYSVSKYTMTVKNILDFIPLTEEQVARIEAVR